MQKVLLEEHRSECASMMDVKPLCVLAEDSKNLIVYDCNRLVRYTALGAW